MKRPIWIVLVALAVLSGPACRLKPKVSDTGYVGTWSRGNDRGVSTVAIARVGDAYRFRWWKRTFDPARGLALDVRCEWNGRCEERLFGELIATYEFSTRTDPATGRLLVECHERRVAPEKKDIHYVDELVVEPGGKVLWSYTDQTDGHRYVDSERPMRSFDKVADAVAGVPEEGAR